MKRPHARGVERPHARGVKLSDLYRQIMAKAMGLFGEMPDKAPRKTPTKAAKPAPRAGSRATDPKYRTETRNVTRDGKTFQQTFHIAPRHGAGLAPGEPAGLFDKPTPAPKRDKYAGLTSLFDVAQSLVPTPAQEPAPQAEPPAPTPKPRPAFTDPRASEIAKMLEPRGRSWQDATVKDPAKLTAKVSTWLSATRNGDVAWVVNALVGGMGGDRDFASAVLSSAVERLGAGGGMDAARLQAVRDGVARALGKESPAPLAPQVPESPTPPKTPGTQASIAAPRLQTGQPAARTARLLQKLGLTDEIAQSNDFHIRIPNDPYIPLVIEKHGNTLSLTHYITEGGDAVNDGEMEYRVSPDGLLTLMSITVRGPRGPHRTNNKAAPFAAMFAKNLMDQGFADVPRSKWDGRNAEGSTPAPAQPAPAPAPTPPPEAPKRTLYPEDRDAINRAAEMLSEDGTDEAGVKTLLITRARGDQAFADEMLALARKKAAKMPRRAPAAPDTTQEDERYTRLVAKVLRNGDAADSGFTKMAPGVLKLTNGDTARTRAILDAALAQFEQTNAASPNPRPPEYAAEARAAFNAALGDKSPAPAAPEAPEPVQAPDAPALTPDAPAERPDYSRPIKDTLAGLKPFGFEMLTKSTRAQRKRANDRAVAVADTLDAEARPATPAEREALAAYTGEGGLSGDLNAHFTPTALAATMWHLLHRAGFKGGRVLEPSMGAGVFVETAPGSAKMTGVEFSDTTGRIARHLHPDADVHPGLSFEQYNRTTDDDLHDGVIANPPYGVRGFTARDDLPGLRQAEMYFLERSLDRLTDGGVGAFLTNHGPFENAEHRRARARMLARCEVVGVYQLPNSVFRDSNAAGAPVLTILRKRPHTVGLALDRLVDAHGEDALKAAGVFDDAFLNGTRHLEPDHMLGTWDGEARTGQFLAYKDIQGDIGPDSLERLSKMPLTEDHGPRDEAELTERLKGLAGEDGVNSALTYAAGQDRGLIPEGKVSDDGQFIMRDHRWHSLNQENPALADGSALATDLARYAGVLNNGRRADAEKLRSDLAGRVEDYLNQHGNPHENPDLKRTAQHHHILGNLMAAVSPDGTLAPHLATPLHDEDAGHDLVDRADPAHVATYLANKGQLTARALAGLWSGADGAESAAQDWLYGTPDYALTNEGRWTPARDYFVGNIEEATAGLEEATARADKTGDARAATKYRAQIEQFQTTLPRKGLEAIRATPRDKWLPDGVVKAFVEEVVDPLGKYSVELKNGVFYITRTGTSTEGRQQRNRRRGKADPEDIENFRKYLNYAPNVDAVRDQENKDADEIRAERAANIEEAKNADVALEEGFANWLSESEFRDDVEDEYNRRFNGDIVPPETGEPLPLEGWTGPALHGYQADAVRHVMAQGAGIMALDVGLGKTIAGLALAQMLTQAGRAKRPMIVAPKSLIGTWRKTIASGFPHKRVLVIGQTLSGTVELKNRDGTPRLKPDGTPLTREVWTDDGRAAVARKIAEAATGSYDLVLITRDKFGDIPLRDEHITRLVAEDVEAQRRKQLESEDGAFKGQGRRGKKKKKDGDGTEREETSDLEKALQKAAARLFGDTTNAVYWDDLGVDALIIDEMHWAKNLHAAPAVYGESPKFMGGGGESKRAFDLNMKARLLRERTGGQGVYGLTATPTKNSPLEIFNMMKHLNDAFEKRGVPSVDDFVSRYCEVGPAIVPMPDGSVEAKPAVLGFRGLGELRDVMARFMYRRTARDVGLKIPEREDHEQYFDMQPEVAAEYRNLADAAKEAAKTRDARGEGHLLAYFGKMRKLTLDPTLLDTAFADLPNPRFQKAAEITASALGEGGKVVMFMDSGSQIGSQQDDEDADGNPIGGANTNAYDRLINHLVEGGVPRDQIEVVTADTAKTSDSRDAISERFNAGQTRVVIGSTGVIGEGFSLQQGTTDMIHLDTPWDPGTYWQRLGRAVRQGNTLETVRNHVLLARGSFDGLTYTSMLGKKGWQDQLYNSTEDNVTNDSGSNFEEMAVMLSSDPAAARATIATKRAELEKATRDAHGQKARMRLGGLARKRRAVTAAQDRLVSQQVAVDEDNTPDNVNAVKRTRRTLERLQGEHDDEVAALQKETAMPPELLPLLEPGAPDFAQDQKGNVYAVGGTINLKGGPGMPDKTMRVVGVDHTRNKAALASYIPTSNDVYSHRPDETSEREYNLDDLASSTDHRLAPDADTERDMLHELVKGYGLDALRRIAPHVTARHRDAIHAGLAAHIASTGSSAHTVGVDGSLKFRDGGSKYLEPGERYLLNTPDDRALFDSAHPNPGMLPYRALSAAPFQFETAYPKNPSTGSIDYTQGKMGHHANPRYVAKADTGLPARLVLYIRSEGGRE